MTTTPLAASMPNPVVRDLSEFVTNCWTELRRAERYHVFVSLAKFEIYPTGSTRKTDSSPDSQTIAEKLVRAVRASDAVSLVNGSSVVVLFPETPRQGAEVATRRLQATIAEAIGLNVGSGTNGEMIARTPSGSFAALSALPSAQLSSFPDAAGARSIPDLLNELIVR